MARLGSGRSNATVIAECLAGPFPELSEKAAELVLTHAKEAESITDLARRLDVPRSTLLRMRDRFPAIREALEIARL